MTLRTIAASLLTITELPYAYDALEPYISAETMHFHHDKHYAGYVAKLSELTEGTRYRGMPLEEVVTCSDGAIFNNAAQALNHVIYFESLSPRAKHHPTGELRRAIDEQFGSVDELKRRMTTTATSLFGSGWVWLATDSDGKLYTHRFQARLPSNTNDIPVGIQRDFCFLISVFNTAHRLTESQPALLLN